MKRSRTIKIIGIVLVFAIVSSMIFPLIYEQIQLHNTKDNYKIAIFDSGISANHQGRDVVDMVDVSFIDADKYEVYETSAEPDTISTIHGDMVLTVLLSHIDNYDELTVYNIRITGTVGEIDPIALEDAGNWAVEQGVNIASLSLGGLYLEDNFLRGAVEPMINAGIFVSVAVGNRGIGDRLLNFIESPAIYPDVVGVGAYLDTTVTDYSSRGGTVFRTLKPDLVASHHGTVLVSGTSFTTPVVSAYAYILWKHIKINYDMDASAGLLKALLVEGAIPIQDRPDQAQGNGKVDMDNTYYVLKQHENELTSFYNVFPRHLPISNDFVWDGIPYYYNFTITHSSEIDPTSFRISVSHSSDIEVWQSYYSKYTSMLHVKYTPSVEGSYTRLSVVKDEITYVIPVQPQTVRVAEKMIYYDSSLSSWELDRNRYGQFYGLFSYLANQNIALIDDPAYSYLDHRWLVDPFSGMTDPHKLLESHNNPDTRIFAMYSTFLPDGWFEFTTRGWTGVENTVVQDILPVRLYIEDYNVTVPYWGWAIYDENGDAKGEPVTINDARLGERTVGLIDDNWFGFLSNYPFDGYAFAGQYPTSEYLEFIDYIITWLFLE